MPKVDIKSIEDTNKLEYEQDEIIDRREEKRKNRDKIKKIFIPKPDRD